MQLIPVKTPILLPPQTDLFAVLENILLDLQEGDILCVSSKVAAIHEGRTVLMKDVDKNELIKAEADFIIPRPYWGAPLTVAHHAFLGAAGIDESNGNGYYILLPKEPFATAQVILQYYQKRFSLKNLGIIITDSHSSPFRYGATGVALGVAGFEPVQDHRGRPDLFGREIQYERSNLADGIAAAATVVAGEVDECVPVVIVRGVPRVTYTNKTVPDSLLVDYKEDTFRVLYESFLPKD